MAVNEKQRDEITFEIKQHIGVISVYPTGWRKELNLVAWNGGAEKIDVRDWDPEHEHMSRGITLHRDEAKKLHELLGQAVLDKEPKQQQHSHSGNYKQEREHGAR